ncbi:protein of unknown function (DUF303) [Abeliophyllum distichum]|uniref:Sialate O-acetylesterase domain-containing protein n=1 Tax=Abeliophyllum distichum TaxID=126358 RepID=A0ABD1SET3_9LAMI
MALSLFCILSLWAVFTIDCYGLVDYNVFLGQNSRPLLLRFKKFGRGISTKEKGHFGSMTPSLINSPETVETLHGIYDLDFMAKDMIREFKVEYPYDVAAISLGMFFLAMFQLFTTSSNLGYFRVFLVLIMLWTSFPCYADKDIFILAGQSNMSGRGGVINGTWTGYIPPECSSNPSILRLSATLMWEVAREPLHKDIDIDATCGVGPGMAFANSVLESDSSLGVIGLVPCAIGGTSIVRWKRGLHLYDQLIKRSKAALEDGGTIRALLWYQGESDTKNEEDAELYGKRLEEFFISVRTDLSSPMLPIIQVALASSSGPYFEIVRKAQLAINLPNVTIVDANGLQLLIGDPIHLSTPGQVKLGKMMADAFLLSY